MKWTGIAKIDPEFKEVEDSKLIRRWHLSISHDRKKVELSFQTAKGKWHTIFSATDEQAVAMIEKGKTE